MNWEAIGAAAELLGALGVIASLVYLARQINHNSRIVEASTNQAVADAAQSRLLAAASSPSLGEAMAKLGAGEASTLTPAEVFQSSFFRHALFRGYENNFFQYRTGLLTERVWHGYMTIILGQFEQQADMGKWWSTNRRSYDAEFQQIVDEIRDGSAV